jgi:cellulose synthase/poly-beta-1,6-N-acetylglucosamine synthase-like glycosyltransferase
VGIQQWLLKIISLGNDNEYMNDYTSHKPKISIITVVYNDENNIKKTVESILNQTYQNIEYVVIDGQSTDETLNIML